RRVTAEAAPSRGSHVILDLHLHSEASDDSRAPVEAYLKILMRKRAERPLDGFVLTEHRKFDPHADYRHLEDKYGFRILRGAEVARLGGIAVPCNPGRAHVGLCAHYETKPPLEGVVAVEALNGGSKAAENERVKDLMAQYGYHGFGGSDSHLVSFIGICATE